MRLAILTGGSRGLGLSLCEKLQARGYHLIEFSRSAPHAWSVKADQADPAAFAETVGKRLAAVDLAGIEELLVISNAGTLEATGLAGSQAWSAVEQNLAINMLSGVAFLNQIVARFSALNCPKTIVSISSGAAVRGIAGWTLYCAAKAGMEGFVRALGVEQTLQAHPFTAITIDPGVMDTGMQEFIRARPTEEFPDVQRFRQRQQDGELASAGHIADAVLHIAGLPDLAQGARFVAREYLAASQTPA
jgi:benzil reductase ((S)-benzoin forming)